MVPPQGESLCETNCQVRSGCRLRASFPPARGWSAHLRPVQQRQQNHRCKRKMFHTFPADRGCPCPTKFFLWPSQEENSRESERLCLGFRVDQAIARTPRLFAVVRRGRHREESPSYRGGSRASVPRRARPKNRVPRSSDRDE